MTFFNFMRNAGYIDVERGERGSTEEHLTVTQFKVQAEQQRLEAVTGQVAQAEQSFGGCQGCYGEAVKRNWKLCEKETKTAKTIALTVQDIEAMGKKATFGNNTMLTPDEMRHAQTLCGQRYYRQCGQQATERKIGFRRKDGFHLETSVRSGKREISGTQTESPAFPGCTGNCI